MRTLLVCTTRNKAGRADGDEFKREALRFAVLHRADGLYFRGEWPGKRRAMTEQFLRSAGELGGPADCVAVFGHGGQRDLYATGHARRHIPGLADALASCLRKDRPVYVVLYCCLTGRGFGFADELDAALEARGLDVRTISHTTAGHTARNPDAEDSGEGPQCRGVDLIPRASHLWRRWVDRLRDDQDFRLSFWRLTPQQLAFELGDYPGPAPVAPLPEPIKNRW